ncbi:Tetraspanin [Gryllus bimaculatus]|nr:Tetraspanin [Gryllus bimaculatus]
MALGQREGHRAALWCSAAAAPRGLVLAALGGAGSSRAVVFCVGGGAEVTSSWRSHLSPPPRALSRAVEQLLLSRAASAAAGARAPAANEREWERGKKRRRWARSCWLSAALIGGVAHGEQLLCREFSDSLVPWNVGWPDYNPDDFTAPVILGKPWADRDISDPTFSPKWNSIDGHVNRQSFVINYSVKDKRPLNPVGRTGLSGRGLLGRWGPNHAADPIVTRWKRKGSRDVIIHPKSQKKILQLVAILRGDSGEWAVPGGMVDPGEEVDDTLKREFLEEACNSLEKSDSLEEHKEIIDSFFDNGEVVYEGYVDDPRNTDNAWVETVAMHFHDDDGNTTGVIPLQAGDDAPPPAAKHLSDPRASRKAIAVGRARVAFSPRPSRRGVFCRAFRPGAAPELQRRLLFSFQLAMGRSGYTCVRHVFCTLNVLMWLCGCGMLGAGIWLRLSYAGYTVFTPQFSMISADSLFIATGVIMFVVAFFGCCGSWFQSRCMLITYFSLVIFMFLVEFLFATLAFVFREILGNTLKQELLTGITKHYENDSSNSLYKTWSHIHHEFHCCGVKDYQDWYYISAWPEMRYVPSSCCIPNMTNITGCGMNDPPDIDIIYTQGCAEQVQMWFVERLHIIGIIGLVIAFIQVHFF